MIESPVLNELIAEMTAKALHRAILGILDIRFGPAPADIADLIATIVDEERLQKINKLAVSAASADDVRQKLSS